MSTVSPDVALAAEQVARLVRQPGPYMNEDGDWWVPWVAVPRFRDARNMVVDHLDYSIPDEGTLVYVGRQMTWLDLAHEEGCETEGPYKCPEMVRTDCWRFLEHRKDWA